MRTNTWTGHIRPLCGLAGQLVSNQRNAVITFVVAPYNLAMTEAEMSRQFSGEIMERIRCDIILIERITLHVLFNGGVQNRHYVRLRRH